MALRILYNSQDTAYKKPFGVVTPEEICTMTVAVPQSCQTTHVTLVLQHEYGALFREVEFTLDRVEAPYEYYTAKFCFQEPGLFYYYFRISTRNEQFRLFKQGNDTNMELTIKASCAIIVTLQYPSFARANTVSEFSQVLFASFFANGTFCFCHLHYINTSQ